MGDLPAIQESFKPPSSLHIPFDDNSQSNEVYDPRLQYSSPPPKRSIHTVYKDGNVVPIDNQATLDAISASSVRRYPSYQFPSLDDDLRDTNHLNTDAASSEDENFLSDEDEQDLLILTDKLSSSPQKPSTIITPSNSSPPKLQWNPPTYYQPSQSSSSSTAAALPMPTPPSSSLNIGLHTYPLHMVALDAKGHPVPFARPAFPAPVRDRSPILGLSRFTVLRTCFRIGEALNVASSASYNNLDAVIELYARTTYSERDANGLKQYFQFADLFRSERPPFLNGSYDIWKGSELWELDSSRFLGEKGKGQIARVVGRIKRDEKTKAWKMTILSIWKASLEDVGYAKGVVCA